MATTAAAERPTATPEEVWATLDRVAKYHEEIAKQQQENERRWKEGIALREAEDAKRRKEETEREAKRRKEEAERRAEDAKRRKEEAEREAKRQAEDAKRRAEEAKRRKEEAEREAKLEAKRQAEDAKRRKEEAEREAKWEAERQAEEAKRQAEDAKRREEEAERYRKTELEWERLFKLFGETDRKIKENDKRVGGLGRSYGKLVEHLVGPGIVKRFGEQGYRFDGVKKQRHKLFDADGDTETEIDLLLENDDTVIAVEVKSRPDRDAEYLGRHLERLEIMRMHGGEEGWEGKRILGAIAGAIFEPHMRNTTLKAGLFVIEQSGDTMKMEVPEGFVPKEW